MPHYTVASGDPDPRGMTVIGADGKVAGTVTDIWVDRAEHLIRYLEVDRRSRHRAAAGADEPRQDRRRRHKGRSVKVHSILAAQFAQAPRIKSPDSGDLPRGRSHLRLLRRRPLYATPSAHGAAAVMEDHDDFAFEPVPGLPELLPQGETLLWQGSSALARAGRLGLPRAQGGGLFRAAAGLAACIRMARRRVRARDDGAFSLDWSALGAVRGRHPVRARLLLCARHDLHADQQAHRHPLRPRAAGDAQPAAGADRHGAGRRDGAAPAASRSR